VKIKKELWFGFSLMAIIGATVITFMPWSHFFDGQLTRQDMGYLGL
jgi:hypothetical protein